MATIADTIVTYETDEGCSNKLIDKIKRHVKGNEKFFSLEFFPPRTPSGTCNLFEKCNRFSRGQPLFCDVTCNINNETDSKSSEHFVNVTSTAQDITQCDAMLQLNASFLTEDSAEHLLRKAKKHGLSTVMAVADLTQNNKSFGDFSSTAELVFFIRENFGTYFTICVAGYPSSLFVDNLPYEQTLNHLHEEVKAGADFIITQMVFDGTEFVNFVEKCHQLGITVPIIPGIMPIQSYGCIQQLSRYSKIKIPDKILNVLKPIRQNDEAVMKYGIYLTVELCKMLLQSMLCIGLHFFTLNRSKVTTEVLKRVGLWKEPQVSRKLPWLSVDKPNRFGEEVRPIFWACRPESYIRRTSEWEEFPNGRWGDSSSASFGCVKDYHLFFSKNERFLTEYKKMWGDKLDCMSSIYDVFVSFVSKQKNKQGYMVTNIPWTEEDLALETSVLSNQLVHINSNGFLTINSQPNVSCANSTDKLFGWGSPGGYVFQKAYLEFFCCEEDTMNLLKVLKEYPSVNYHCVNYSGTENFSNASTNNSNAVTWGVFTGSMVIQPTVVDPVAFQFWKDEAFELWLQQWGNLYDENTLSWRLIKYIHDTFYLVNLVDNNYVKGNCLFEIVNRVISMRDLDGKENSDITKISEQTSVIQDAR